MLLVSLPLPPPQKEILRPCLVIYKTISFPSPPTPAFLPCHPTLVQDPRIQLQASLVSVSYKEREKLTWIPFLWSVPCSPGLGSKAQIEGEDC